MEIRKGQGEAGLLMGLADGAFERRFAQAGFELAANRTPDAEIRRLGAQHQQLFAGGIFHEYKHREFVIER